MKRIYAFILVGLAIVLMGAAASTSLVYKYTGNNTLTGNLVIGDETSITTSGTGTISGNVTGTSGDFGVTGNLTVSGAGTSSFAGQVTVAKAANGYDTVKLTGASGNHVGLQYVQTGVQTWSTYNVATTGDFTFNNGTVDALKLSATTGDATFASTTAATNTTSGALRVGSNVGLSGNAGGPSYFGGNLTVGGAAASATALTVNANGSVNSHITFVDTNTGGKTWAMGPESGTGMVTDFGLYNITDSALLLKVSSTGTLTLGAASNALVITTSQTPASASATGTTGTICWDANYVYVCTATNTWKRTAIATW